MKKIVLVCNTSWGMMMFRLGLMKRLVSLGYDVTVIAPKDDHSEKIKALGCHYIDVEMDNKGSSILKDIRLYYTLKKHYQEIKPDLIFHYTIKPNVYGTWAARESKCHSVAVITGLGYTFLNHNMTASIAKFLYKYTLKHADKVWFINYEDRKKFIKEKLLKRDLVEVIPGEGVNMEYFAPREKTRLDEKIVFTLIARILWDKGVGEYVKAAKMIGEKYDNVEFQLVGFLDAKNPSAISKEQVDAWEKNGWIRYMGSTDDVRLFIQEADCIVLPSYREGISKILMESASMAKPIITTNVPGCRDIIENSVSGYLCKLKDSSDLAHKIDKFLQLTTEERLKMGRAGRVFVKEHFDEEIILSRYLETIRSFENRLHNQKFRLKKD